MAVPYNVEVPLEFREIDPVQNNGVAFTKTMPTNSLLQATAGTTISTTTGLPVPVTTGITGTGTVLVRLVNAGLRMHVPSIVNSLTQGFNGAGAPATVAGFTLIAEELLSARLLSPQLPVCRPMS